MQNKIAPIMLCIGYLEIDSLLTYGASYQNFDFLPTTTSPKCIEVFKRGLSGGFLPTIKEQTSSILLSSYHKQSSCKLLMVNMSYSTCTLHRQATRCNLSVSHVSLQIWNRIIFIFGKYTPNL